MLNQNIFSIFAGQSITKTFVGGTDLNLYRNFLNQPELNGSTSLNRIGPDLTFTRPSNATYFTNTSAIAIAQTNEPRFDHTPNGQLEGLLIEGQKTNLIESSTDFTNNIWNIPNNGITVISDVPTVIAPDNTQTATLLRTAPVFGFHVISWSGTPVIDEGEPPSSADYYDRSIFIKKETARYIVFSTSPTVSTSTGNLTGNDVFEVVTNIFDFDTKQFTQLSILNSTITPLRDGWYRLSFGRTSTNNAVNRLTIGIANGPNFQNSIYDVDITGLSGVYVWGAQTEIGKYTSYIPTNGSQVTRSGDNVSIIRNNFTTIYNPSASTFFIKGKRNSTQLSTLVNFTNVNATNYWTITTPINDRESYSLVINSLDTSSTSINTTFVGEYQPFKLAASLRENDAILYLDNQLMGTLENNVMPPSTNNLNRINRFQLGRFNNINYFDGHIQEFGYWPTRLSNSEVQELTQ